MEGTIDASDQREAANILRSRGLFVTSLVDNREVAIPSPRPSRRQGQQGYRAAAMAMAVPGSAGKRKTSLFGSKVSMKELALFCRQFATMINAGVAILTSLNILTRQSSSKGMRSALGDVSVAVERGSSLSDAFRSRSDVFPALLVNMVAAGEVGGILEECFDRLAEHFEKENAVSQKVKSAMSYPAVISVVAIGVVVFMITFVLPNFISIFEQIGATLPGPTLAVLAISGFIRTYWYLILAALLLALVALRYYAGTPQGAYFFDALALKIPVFGQVILKRAISRFARTLATLLRSGVPLLVSLGVVEKTVGSRPVAAAVLAAEDEIRAGHGLVNPLQVSGLFPQMVLEMMTVGEETGAVDSMLSKVADFYDKEIDATVERLSTMIEPIIIVVIGGIVGFLLVSLIMPMFDMYSQFNM